MSNDQKITFSKKFLTLHHDLWLEGKKRVNYIWVLEIMIYDIVHKGYTKHNIFSVFGEPLRNLCSKESNFNFWNRLHQKIAFLCRFLTRTVTLQPNHTMLTLRFNAIRKAMTNLGILAPSLGGSEFLIYIVRFFQQERILWGSLDGPPPI